MGMGAGMEGSVRKENGAAKIWCTPTVGVCQRNYSFFAVCIDVNTRENDRR